VDYVGEAEVRVDLDDQKVAQGAIVIPVRQVYRRPDTVLMVYNLGGLQQWRVLEGSVERTWTKDLAIAIIEKRFINLNQSAIHPSSVHYLSMAQMAQTVRGLKSVRLLGQEVVAGHACEKVEFPNKELIEGLQTTGLVSEKVAEKLGAGVSNVWVTNKHGLPVKLAIYPPNSDKATIYFEFRKVTVNTGVPAKDTRIEAPRGTPIITVNCDLADPKWEDKADKEIAEKLKILAKGG